MFGCRFRIKNMCNRSRSNHITPHRRLLPAVCTRRNVFYGLGVYSQMHQLFLHLFSVRKVIRSIEHDTVHPTLAVVAQRSTRIGHFDSVRRIRLAAHFRLVSLDFGRGTSNRQICVLFRHCINALIVLFPLCKFRCFISP